jgi:hypothetical protein
VSSIASSIPGRLRLRHVALRHVDRLAQLRAAVATWPGVQTLTANPTTGSLLVMYYPAVLSEAQARQRGEAAVTSLLPRTRGATPSAQVVRPAVRMPRVPDWSPARVNRVAKPMALGSLLASLAFAAAGTKRLHVVAGAAFLPALGAHLWIQRRNLFR